MLRAGLVMALLVSRASASSAAPTLVPVAAGVSHSCTLTNEGGVRCWGTNLFGQLGDGTYVDRLTPVDVIGLTGPVASLAAGDFHSCALTSAGAAKCWGGNHRGQLGDGTTTGRPTPGDIVGLTSGVTAIANGTLHSCAVTDTGIAKCWGDNSRGQLGDGTTTHRSTPVDVLGLTTSVTAIANGFRHSCALTSAGGVKCWGSNSAGQLGDGTTTDRWTPVDVIGLTSGVTAIANGFNYSCAMTSAAGVKCWGDNSQGQLGDGTKTDRATPVDVIGLTNGVTAISSGGAHSCAVTSTGGVKCWGWNDTGQLGDKTTTDRLTSVGVAGLARGVTTIAAGLSHTCARTAAGSVKCWGSNEEGQLGNGIASRRLEPLGVIGLAEGATAIANGSAHSCALTNTGGVACWGANSDGQLGDGTATTRSTPVAVVDLTSLVTAIASGFRHSCAVTSVGGARCWGNNSDGQLGDGTTTNRSTPVGVLGLTSGIAAIANGSAHTCALTNAGGVRCWGDNSSGQLGDGTTTDQSTPVDVIGLASGVTAIANGYLHSCALTDAGGVKCWGDNSFAQLGDGTTSNRPAPVDVVDLATGVVGLATGSTHSCAVTIAGGVKCWGANFAGQLGDGTAVDRLTPLDVVGLTTGITTTAAGFAHSCSLTNTGGVKCWGHNFYGQLGDGTTPSRYAPVDVVGLTTGIAAIATGYDHSCAITSAGAVTCWGRNSRGQLGNGELGYSPTAVDVVGFGSCGDGVVDPGEKCDDGNATEDDCCSAACELQNAPSDTDADGICNAPDNCPFTYNPDQRDSDASAGGDLCDVCPSDSEDRCAAARTTAGTIDGDGAEITVPDQSLTLEFPEGALDGPTSVSATGGLTESGYGLKLLPDKSPLGFELQPSGQRFKPKVALTFRWRDANDNCFVDNPATSCPVESHDSCPTARNPACDLPVRERDLKVFRNGEAYPDLGTTCALDPWNPSKLAGCDPEANQWTIKVKRFSEYVLGECAVAKQRKLTIGGLAAPRGDETLRLRARMDVETPTAPAVDPTATGIGLLVETARGRTLYAVPVPGGAYDEATGTGWKKKPNRDLWTYTSTTAKGVTAASVLWTDGRVKFDVTAAGLKLRKLKKKDLPLVARFVLDGRCGDASFAGPAPAPACVRSADGSSVECR